MCLRIPMKPKAPPLAKSTKNPYATQGPGLPGSEGECGLLLPVSMSFLAIGVGDELGVPEAFAALVGVDEALGVPAEAVGVGWLLPVGDGFVKGKLALNDAYKGSPK